MVYKDIIIPPGETIIDLLEERNISKSKFMTTCGFDKNEFGQLINGDIEVTYGIAFKLSEFFKLPIMFWLNLERRYRDELRINGEHKDDKS